MVFCCILYHIILIFMLLGGYIRHMVRRNNTQAMYMGSTDTKDDEFRWAIAAFFQNIVDHSIYFFR